MAAKKRRAKDAEEEEQDEEHTSSSSDDGDEFPEVRLRVCFVHPIDELRNRQCLTAPQGV